MGNHEHWPFDDPAKVQGDKAERVEATRVVRDQIDQRVTEWLNQQDIHPVSQ
jgi:arsenate reductase